MLALIAANSSNLPMCLQHVAWCCLQVPTEAAGESDVPSGGGGRAATAARRCAGRNAAFCAVWLRAQLKLEGKALLHGPHPAAATKGRGSLEQEP